MGPDQHDSSRELDDLVRSSRRSFIAGNDARFDFAAGLADVYERAGGLTARVPATRPGGGRGPSGAAVAAACEHIDDFVALLGQVMLAGPAQAPIGSQVERVAEVLLQVRDHLAAGTLSQAVVADVFAVARDALVRADLIMSVERGQSLDEVLNASPLLASEDDPSVAHASALRRLEREVGHVLSPGGPDPAPGSRRQRNQSRHDRRRAEGS